MITKTPTDAPKSIRSVMVLWLCGISFLAVFALTAYTLWIQYRNFNQEVTFLKKRFIEDQKALMAQKVNAAIDYARYKEHTTEKRLKENIRARVDEAHHIANHLYEFYHHRLPPSEIATLIKETLRPIRFNQGRGYYFIVSLSGVEELYPTHPEIEGENLWNLQDIKGKRVIQDEIQTVQNLGEGFVTGYWPNPSIQDDQGSLQYCFVKRFSPLNWLIGTGEFLDNVQREVQQETIDWLTRVRYGDGNYIFIDTYEGNALIMDGQTVDPPQNIWSLQDPNGIKVIQEETRIARNNPDGGYLSYAWRKTDDAPPVSILSFVKAIPEWQWVVGSGIFMDDIDRAIDEKRNMLQRNVKTDLGLILLGFLVSLPLIVLVAIMISNKFNREFAVFVHFFNDEHRQTNRIRPHLLKIREFAFLAHAANGMVRRQRNAEKQLENLSRTDPLTGLPNRRDMAERIALETTRANRNRQAFAFVIIDIDHFKAINDTYGHDAGDAVLQAMATQMRKCIRRHDFICRWGGEEFLILLPETRLQNAERVAEKIRRKIAHHHFEFNRTPIHITLTCGVSLAMPDHDPHAAITAADRFLLLGKEQGRNRVVSAA